MSDFLGQLAETSHRDVQKTAIFSKIEWQQSVRPGFAKPRTRAKCKLLSRADREACLAGCLSVAPAPHRSPMHASTIRIYSRASAWRKGIFTLRRYEKCPAC